MKKLQFSLSGGVLGLLLAATTAAEGQTGQRLSREELIARRDAAKEVSSRLLPKEGKADSQSHPSQSSVLDRSILLSNGRNWTFIPKGALFCVPEKYQDRVNLATGKGKFLPFAQFAQKNRQWLRTYSVTLEQARGNAPISEEAREALVEGGRVVVSVCKGGPISTRAPKVAMETAKN